MSRSFRHDRWQEWEAARRVDEKPAPAEKLAQSRPEGLSALALDLGENPQPGSKLVQ